VSHTLLPESGKRFLFFEGQRILSSDFGRVDWIININQNMIKFSSLTNRNLSLLTLVLDDWTPVKKTTATLNYLRVITENPMPVALRGYATEPQVWIGNTQLPESGPDWSYDLGTQTATINEGQFTVATTWKIFP